MTEPFGPDGSTNPELSAAPVSLEPTSQAVPTAAVEVLSADGTPNAPIANPGRRRLRWAIAAVATAVVIAGSSLGFAVLASARTSSAVLPWAPADAILYAEVRADLPGDQRANLLAFLSKFPGFADQTSFDTKADDGLNRLVKRLTNDKHDFSTEIKPWFGGQVGVSVEGSSVATPAALIVISVRDVAGASAWLKSVTPADATHETVGGIDLIEHPAASGEPGSAYAIDGSVILAGSIDSVKAAIGRGAAGALAGSAGFKAAAGTLGGDELGGLYMDVKGYFNWFTSLENRMLSQQALPSTMAIPSLNTALLPGWIAVRLRAESSDLVVDAAVAATDAQTGAIDSHQSTLAASLPASTVLEYELHSVGKTIKDTLTQLEAQPGGLTVAQVDSVAKYVGGVDKAVGWLGDASVAVLHDGTGFSGGLVARTTDPTASANLVTELKNLVSLGGGQAGITVSEETYAGQTITLISGDFNQLHGSGAIVPGMAGSLGKVQLAIAQTSSLVIAGVGDGFVKAVLDTRAGSALADQAAYQKAINLAGANNAGQMFVNLTALRTAIEALAAKSSGIAAYDSDIKPYLIPIESIALSVTASNGVASERFVLVLK